MSIVMIWSGATVFFILGFLHLVYSFLDVSKPERFAPADADVLRAMQKTTIRMRPDAKNLWLSSLGFHFSHSIGVLFYAGVCFFVGANATLAADPIVIAPLVFVAFSYVALARLYWFVVPFVGALIGAIFITSGLVLANVS